MQMEGHLVVDTDRIITVSNSYAKLLQETFMTDRKIDVTYNGISDEWKPEAGIASMAISEEGLSTERPIALFVGRVADMKGIRAIIKAVESKDTGYQVVIVGEVSANTEAQRNAWDVTKALVRLEKEYPERLRWVGFRDGDKLKNLYASATVGLMPSTHEPFGIVALEHMAMGVPLICSEVQGLGEIVNGKEECAMIIRPKAEDIIDALEEMKDPLKCCVLSGLGLERVKDFTWEETAEKTVEIYKETINATRNID